MKPALKPSGQPAVAQAIASRTATARRQAKLRAGQPAGRTVLGRAIHSPPLLSCNDGRHSHPIGAAHGTTCALQPCTHLVHHSTAAEAAPVTRMVIDRRRCAIAGETTGLNGQGRQGRGGSQAEVRWEPPAAPASTTCRTGSECVAFGYKPSSRRPRLDSAAFSGSVAATCGARERNPQWTPARIPPSAEPPQ